MDFYSFDYVAQQAPLVVFQGLGKQKFDGTASVRSTLTASYITANSQPTGERLSRVLAPVGSEFAEPFVSALQENDVGNDVWVSCFAKSKYDVNSLAYRFQFVDSSYTLPSKQDKPQRQRSSSFTTKAAREDPLYSESKSLLSPFNPSSATYPSGLVDINWLAKHRDSIPSVLVSVHALKIDPESKEAEDSESLTKDDLSLSKEITTIKNQVQSFGIRFLEVIIAESTDNNVVHRVNNIRNITGLYPRTGLLLLQPSAGHEYANFAKDILHLIKPWCFDHYINLEKKIRKRRVNPPSSQLSKSVSFDDGDQKYSLEQWDARCSIKLAFINLFHQNNEMSLKHLESAYSSLLQLASSLSMPSHSRDSRPLLLWYQIRYYLDVIIINIVKTYFYLELSNKAYKRFRTHISTVADILESHSISSSYSLQSWLSIQYEWFGDLCCAADDFIAPADRPLLFEPEFDQTSLPNSGFLYLQAVKFLKDMYQQVTKLPNYEESSGDLVSTKFVDGLSDVTASEKIVDCFGSLPQEDINRYPIHSKLVIVLQKALIAFMRAKEGTFERTLSYVKFELAEENLSLGNYDKAMGYYQECFSIYKHERWKSLLVHVLSRLIQCSSKSENRNQFIMLCCELAVIDDIYFPPEVMKQLSTIPVLDLVKVSDTPSTIELYPFHEPSSPPCLFNGVFLFKAPILALSQKCYMQLAIKNLINHIVLADIIVESITITFRSTFPTIVLENDENIDSSNLIKVSDFENKEDTLSAKVNLKFGAYDCKVFQFERLTHKVGTVAIDSIVMKLKHSKFELNYHLPTDYLAADDSFLEERSTSKFATNGDSKHHKQIPKSKFFWVDGMTKDKYFKRSVVLTENPFEFVTIPRRPKTNISVENPSTAFSNEIYEVRLLVDNQDDEDIGVIFRASVKMYDTKPVASPLVSPPLPNANLFTEVTSPRKSLDLRQTHSWSPKGIDMVASPNFGDGGVIFTNATWDSYDKLLNLGKEESLGFDSLDLKIPRIAAESKEFHSLFIEVPAVVLKHFVLKVECSFFTGEDIAKQQEEEEISGSLSIRDTFSIRTPIIDPLKFGFSFVPQINQTQPPSGLVFDPSSPSNNGKFPKYLRQWLARSTVSLVGTVPIEIVDIQTHIGTSSPDDFSYEHALRKDTYGLPALMNKAHPSHVVEETFCASAKRPQTGVPMPVEINIKVKWRRYGTESNIVNVFNSKFWRFRLQLSDPRVLLEIAPSTGTINPKTSKTVILRYHVENPTSKIFNFSTHLASNEMFDISGPNKEIPHLLVMPFTNQVLEFIASAKVVEPGSALKLPSMKVYDLNYKVTLPIGLGNAFGQLVKGDIYVKL